MKYILKYLIGIILVLLLIPSTLIIILWHFKLNPYVTTTSDGKDKTLKDVWLDLFEILQLKFDLLK